MKSILITGCSSGIGYDCAKTLQANGWRVFASCRKPEDCARLEDEGLESPLIDLADPESTQNAIAEITAKTGGTLDALFNNGAFGIPGAVEDLPTDALRNIFETNLFSYHELTRQVIPVMRTQGHGRILNCSSVLGLVAMRYRGAYNATKFAMEGLTDTLRLEMRGTNIHVCLIEPGPITTNIRENARPHFERWIDWENSPRFEEYKRLRHRLYAPYSKDTFELPPSAVTKSVIHALTHPNPKPRYGITKATHLMAGFRRILPTRLLDQVAAKF